VVRFSDSLRIIDLRSAPHQDLVLGQFEIDHHDDFAILAAAFSAASLTRLARSAPAQAGCSAGQHREIDNRRQGHFLGVNLEDRFRGR